MGGIMLRDAFLEIMKSYPIESANKFAGNIFADFIRHEFPDLFRSYFPEYESFIWDASPGKGRWADAPWLAIFNPLVTDTAQKGYYPVFLFSNSLNTVYLSLNQGMAELREEFGDSQAREILIRRANILRSRVTPEYGKYFNSEPIDLEHHGAFTRLAFYEPGHVFGTKYTKDDMPSNDEIIADLTTMLELYNLAFHRGGTREFDTDLPHFDQTNDESLAEKKQMRVHLTADRNPKLIRRVKEAHGYTCEICGFNFEEKYGELGKDFIEAHHLTPFSELPEDKVINLSPETDFAVVCSNCHSMLHRKGAPKSFDGFKKYFDDVLDK
jgi:5-methylcytosine-specific restriction protein A